MTLVAGDKLGPYEVIAPLGAGGMGEVYRARDPRLGREVALKVLPAAFAQDSERVARFEREAKLLASLNHPRIGALYGLEESEGRRVLVLELVEGMSLAERLRRGPLPLDEALPIACQIASALEAAHESGVVHRDLKPGNVMLRPDGTVKVLDFGLAKGGATEGTSSDPKLSASPTMTYAATQAGVILGTAAYMSPEQARGRAVDRRSDIWSFGCLVFELLTGKQAFMGETVSDTIASILKGEPDWDALPPGTPKRVSDLLRRCVRKDASLRLRDIGDARIELEEVIASPDGAGDAQAAAPVSARASGPARGSLALMGVVTLLAIAFAAWSMLRGGGDAAGSHMRFVIPASGGVTPPGSVEAFAIAPDGAAIAFVSQDSLGNSAVWLRKLASIDVERVTGSENAIGVFWSPDSKQLGIFADGKLKTITLASGVVRTLCDAPDPRGAAWGNGGTIVFAPVATGPLRSVGAESGDAVDLLTIDPRNKGENSLRYPTFLPDGKHFLFVSLPRIDGQFSTWMGEVGSHQRRLLMKSEAAPVWAGQGHIVTVQHDRFVALPFDPGSGKVQGKSVDLGEAPLNLAHDGAYVASASNDGKLVFCSGTLANTELVWLDRSGRRIGTVPMPAGRWETFAISSDGTKLAVGKRLTAGETKLWLVDIATGQGSPLGTIAAQAGIAFSPDGRTIAYQKELDGVSHVFVRSADGGAERALEPGTHNFQNLWAWSPDSKMVFYSTPNPGTNWDAMAIPVDGSHPAERLVSTPANEAGAVLSPDMHTMLYSSDESGRLTLYASAYPGGGERRQLPGSGLGATSNNYFVDWAKSGGEVFVFATDAVVIPVEPGPTPQFGPAHKLFTPPAGAINVVPAPDYQRFLVSVPLSGSAAAQLTVEANWWAVLKGK